MIDVKDDPNRVGSPRQYYDAPKDKRPLWSNLSHEERYSIVDDFLIGCHPVEASAYALKSLEYEDPLKHIASIIERLGKNEDFVL